MALVPVASIKLLDERLDLADVMNTLAEKGGVAIAVVGDASPGSLGVAERRLMPLLRLPDGSHVTEVQQAVVRYIVERRTFLHDQAQLLQMELMQLALSGSGTDAIVARLGEVTGRVVAWNDAAGKLRSVPASCPAACARPWATGMSCSAGWRDRRCRRPTRRSTSSACRADAPAWWRPSPGATESTGSCRSSARSTSSASSSAWRWHAARPRAPSSSIASAPCCARATTSKASWSPRSSRARTAPTPGRASAPTGSASTSRSRSASSWCGVARRAPRRSTR